MPQKQNPVLSVLIRSAALQAPALAAQLHLAAANFNDERPDGAWHTEWPALRQLLAAGPRRRRPRSANSPKGCRFSPTAMRRNLDLAGPLLLAEAVNAAVAPLLDRPARRRRHRLGWTGKQQLQDVVDRTLQAPAAEQAATYRKLLREAVPENCSPTPGWRSFWTRPTTSARPPRSPAASSRRSRNSPPASATPPTHPETELPWLNPPSKQSCFPPSARWATSPSSSSGPSLGHVLPPVDPGRHRCWATTTTSSPGTCPDTASRPRPQETFNVAELADAVVDLVDSIAPATRFHYAGVSLGGATGLQLGIKHGDRLKSLSVQCSGAKLGTPEGWLERAETVRTQGTPVMIQGSAQRWFAPGFMDREPEVSSRLLHALRDADRFSYAFCCEALAGFDVRDQLGSIQRPHAGAGRRAGHCGPAVVGRGSGGRHHRRRRHRHAP